MSFGDTFVLWIYWKRKEKVRRSATVGTQGWWGQINRFMAVYTTFKRLLPPRPPVNVEMFTSAEMCRKALRQLFRFSSFITRATLSGLMTVVLWRGIGYATPCWEKKRFKELRSLHWANSRLDEFLIWPELNELFLWESCYDVCYLCSLRNFLGTTFGFIYINIAYTQHIQQTHHCHKCKKTWSSAWPV